MTPPTSNYRAILTELFQNGRQYLYGRGDTVIRAGDTPSGVYLITDGWIQVYSLCDNGESNIISSLARADIFPLEWAISGKLHDVTFAALGTTRLLRIPRDHFIRITDSDPQIARTMSQILTDYYFRLSRELENLPYRSARERVAFRLISLADRFGDSQGPEVVIGQHVPNEYIARSSNMTRETASREVSRLHQKGLIRNKNGYIIIKDLAGLKHEAGKSFGQ